MLPRHSVKPPDIESVFNQSFPTTISSSSLRFKTILITGSQGMLGHGLAVAINCLMVSQNVKDFKVILSSRKWSDASTSFWKKSPNIVLINNQQISSLKCQVDLVIHTASPSNITQISTFEELTWANVGLLKEVLKLSPQKIVYVSSGEVYGGGNTDEKMILSGFSKQQKRDWYPISKLETENELRAFQLEGEIDVCIIRLFHTFGPGVKADDGRSFADILWGAALNNQIILKSQGDQVRTFLYLSDALDGIISISLNDTSRFLITNLGSSIPTTIFEFARLAANISGATVEFEVAKDFQHSPNKSIVPNIEKMLLTGWNQKISLEEGIRRTISWIKDSTLGQM
jgi:UDP-glucuronate decarboxylase